MINSIVTSTLGLNIFISFYNYTSIQIYMMIIQAMGLEWKLKAYKVLLPNFNTLSPENENSVKPVLSKHPR